MRAGSKSQLDRPETKQSKVPILSLASRVNHSWLTFWKMVAYNLATPAVSGTSTPSI